MKQEALFIIFTGFSIVRNYLLYLPQRLQVSAHSCLAKAVLLQYPF